MPTAADFRRIADALDDKADEIATVQSVGTGFGSHVVSGGGLKTMLDNCVCSVEDACTGAAATVRELAGECRTRAAEVADWNRRMDDYEDRAARNVAWRAKPEKERVGQAEPWVGSPPTPPGPWAERS